MKDPSGAPVADVRVTLVATGTRTRRIAVTSSDGFFEFPQLEPAVWTLSAESPGFKRASIPQMVVQVDQATRADLVLELGEQSETVEVTAISPQLDSERSTLTGTVDSSVIAAVPLNGRQFLDLAMLTPGIVPAASGTQGSGFNAAGARSQSNVYLLDGVSNQDTQTNQPLNLFRITDAVEEFSVQTSVPLPEFGRGSGGQVNIVTRGGANQFHGSAFEYFRNTQLNAADFFTNKLSGLKDAINRNQFGATLGGAVIRNRAFFFASYEGFRQVAPLVSSARVPSLAERASVTDIVSKRLLAYWPLPDADGALNYISNVRGVDSDNTGLIRLDHRAGDRDQLSGHWAEYRGDSVVPGPTPLNGGNQGPPRQRSAMLSDAHTFSSALPGEIRLGYSRNSQIRTVQDFGWNAASVFTDANGIALPGVVDATKDPLNSGLPTITVAGGYAALGTNANFPQGRVSDTVELFANLSWKSPLGARKHTWRWGSHVRREGLSRYLDRSSRGAINFAAFADFARGQVNTSTFRTGSTQANWRRIPWDLFWQDEFRPRPNLTLFYGLRYEYPSAVEETHGHATNFVPGYGPMPVGTNRILDIDPALKGPASLIYRQAPFTLPSSGVRPDRNNFAPMFGFAWTPLAATVIRGGFRMAYDDLFNNVPSSMALGAPNNLQTSQTANVTQPAKFPWALAFDQNVPLVSNSGKQGPGAATVGVLTFQGIDPNLRSAYAYEYHFGIQHRLFGDLSIEAGYQGNSGRRLGIFVDVNQPAVIVRDPARRGPVAPNEQIFPYHHFNQAQVAQSIGNSNYNGLVLTARYQARRMLLQGSYTLGKSLDYNSSYFGSGNLPGETGAPADNTNLRLDHGPSAFDVRQRFNLVYVVRAPAGFEFSGVTTLQTGTPFTVVTGGPDASGFNQINSGISPDGGNRPDTVRPGPLPQSNRNPDAAFDPSWFAAAPAGRVGTSGRNQYAGPGLQNYDLAAARSFWFGGKLGEQTRLQFRADFFNLFNHTNYANPIADTTNASFGKITQTLGSAVATSTGTAGGPVGGPRLIQLSLRLRF